jgi:ubiquitin-conjugating enzyme E2 G2
MTEYRQLVSNGSPDGMFTAGPISEDDFFTWEALIEGPKDTPFEGGVFLAKLNFVSCISYVLRSTLTIIFAPKAD